MKKNLKKFAYEVNQVEPINLLLVRSVAGMGHV